MFHEQKAKGVQKKGEIKKREKSKKGTDQPLSVFHQ